MVRFGLDRYQPNPRYLAGPNRTTRTLTQRDLANADREIEKWKTARQPHSSETRELKRDICFGCQRSSNLDGWQVHQTSCTTYAHLNNPITRRFPDNTPHSRRPRELSGIASLSRHGKLQNGRNVQRWLMRTRCLETPLLFPGPDFRLWPRRNVRRSTILEMAEI